MASPLKTEMKVISPDESRSDYGFKVGRKVVITGMELTAEKVKLLMKEAAIIANNFRRIAPADALAAYNKFKALCKQQQANLTIDF